jgi:hypothetical protein
MSLPLIPFAKIPHKQWKDKETEKKPRLVSVEHENEVFYIKKKDEQASQQPARPLKEHRKLQAGKRFGGRRNGGMDEDDDEEENNDEDDSGSDESSEYDLLEHIKELLPEEIGAFGYNGDGLLGRNGKKANAAHLDDLQLKKKKRDYFFLFNFVIRRIEEARARERERRKHHLLRHFEQKVKEYDSLQKQKVEEAFEKKKNQILLEDYHRQQRIDRNSKKVRAKLKLIPCVFF